MCFVGTGPGWVPSASIASPVMSATGTIALAKSCIINSSTNVFAGIEGDLNAEATKSYVDILFDIILSSDGMLQEYSIRVAECLMEFVVEVEAAEGEARPLIAGAGQALISKYVELLPKAHEQARVAVRAPKCPRAPFAKVYRLLKSICLAMKHCEEFGNSTNVPGLSNYRKWFQEAIK